MPDAPPRSFLVHLFLESPIPAVAILGLIGVVLLWRGARDGTGRTAAGGAGLLLLAAGVYGLARAVVTDAERGRNAVRSFVAAVEADDVAAADAILDPDLTLHRARESNPGLPRALVTRGISIAHDQYGLQSASITSLEGWADPDRDDAAIVHLSVTARTGESYGTPTRWRFRVAADEGGVWRITRMTWIDMLGRTPPTIR